MSPLIQIEHSVQDRAKALAIDTSTSEGEARLRELIDDSVEAWQDDHRRGIRSHPLGDPIATAERAFRDLARYGPLTPLLG